MLLPILKWWEKKTVIKKKKHIVTNSGKSAMLNKKDAAVALAYLNEKQIYTFIYVQTHIPYTCLLLNAQIMSVNHQSKPSWPFYFYSAPKIRSDCRQPGEALHVFHHIWSPGFDRICVGEGSKSEGLKGNRWPRSLYLCSGFRDDRGGELPQRKKKKKSMTADGGRKREKKIRGGWGGTKCTITARWGSGAGPISVMR